MTTAELDCRTCGACCTAFAADGGERLKHLPISKPEYKRLPADVRVMERSEFGALRSLRFVGQRCAALVGVVGLDVSCRVYDERPRICRVFPVGSPNCLAARADAGIR